MAGPGQQGPADVSIFIDGYDLTPEKVQSAQYEEESETAESTGLGDSFREHAPTGMAAALLEMNNAIFNTDTGRSHAILSGGPSSDPQATPRIVCILPAGSSIGSEAAGFQGVNQNAYRVVLDQADLQRVNASFQVTGAKEEGKVIHPHSTETAAGNTQTTSVDHGAGPTEAGGSAYLHLSAFEGWDGIVAKIQDSSNDIAYADLLTFTSVSDTGSPTVERVALGSTAEVQRYIAAAWTLEGAGPGSAEFMLMFARGSTY